MPIWLRAVLGRSSRADSSFLAGDNIVHSRRGPAENHCIDGFFRGLRGTFARRGINVQTEHCDTCQPRSFLAASRCKAHPMHPRTHFSTTLIHPLTGPRVAASSIIFLRFSSRRCTLCCVGRRLVGTQRALKNKTRDTPTIV